MHPRQRKRHSQAGTRISNVVAFSVRDFFARFPDDDSCLNHIMAVRYGDRHPCDKCLNLATFHRITGRPAFACAHCGHHIYPCAGTIFQDSRTSLQMWFYAIYLFVVTRHGVSGKELQRAIGVTYKTAYRMGMQIRKLMGSLQDFDQLQGHVEIDEAYMGGHRPGKHGRGAADKTIVLGMKERGGDIRAQAIPNAQKATVRGVVTENVAAGSIVSTDEFVAYSLLGPDGYEHGAVKHGAREWANYDEDRDITFCTNGVESFWKLFKDSVDSTHIHISQKHMNTYLGEFTFRSNHRQMKNAMFDLLIGAL